MQPMKNMVLSSATQFSSRLGVTAGITEIHEGQVAEEKAHGRVELGTDPDDRDHSQVPHHRDCVFGQEYQEQGIWRCGYPEKPNKVNVAPALRFPSANSMSAVGGKPEIK